MYRPRYRRGSASYALCTFNTALWRIQSAQRRFISRNAAIDYHGPAYRYYRTYIHIYLFTYIQSERGKSTTSCTLTRSLYASSFSHTIYIHKHRHTPIHYHIEPRPRTNDIASYNTRASNITGAILPPREINVSSCHLDYSIVTAVKFPISQKCNTDNFSNLLLFYVCNDFFPSSLSINGKRKRELNQILNFFLSVRSVPLATC